MVQVCDCNALWSYQDCPVHNPKTATYTTTTSPNDNILYIPIPHRFGTNEEMRPPADKVPDITGLYKTDRPLVIPHICPYCGNSQTWVEHDICIGDARDALLNTDLPEN